ncbi:MAG TPA: histidinol dehydrogenase [Candidatus Hydrogenedentes bacterium]|nr:histidinol dehydrogenase [Candidatus Hydrogenedentota bacterium]HPG67408.1 histidinol dehydrogenase [Candidatus Hydrogenedentota bacterium]
MKRFEITDKVSFEETADRICGLNAIFAAEEAVRTKTKATKAIVEAVRARGDDAVAEYTERFDGVALTPDHFEVLPAEIDAAYASVDPELRQGLERAQANIRRFHETRLRGSWRERSADGTVLGQRITPIERAGVYVPGGKAFYPSSVLMNIVPACVAGVEEIVMVSPPSYHGTIHPVVLTAARIAGATRVFRIGGAQAVAALAFGTGTIPAVVKITGPGNTFVTVAKRLVRGVCEIDTEAGPSEVVVIADESADARFVAAELLAQAEHDEEARAMLITTSPALADKVDACIVEELALLSRADMIRRALDAQGLVVVVNSVSDAVALTNRIAPEHLSIQTSDPWAVCEQIRNAGAIMLGAMTPVAVGDYYAGPNHILPTSGRARYASPLSAEDFRKTSSLLAYSRERLERDAPDIRRLAEAEGLTAHARAVEIRL